MAKEIESSVGRSLRELLTYISHLGEHVNQIYNRLDQIDASMQDIKKELEISIESNKKELMDVKKITTTKSEFNDLIKKLNEPFKEFTPPSTPRQPQK
jgi:predicted RNase H-like nuclease (RuvC/YqgF family)